MKLDDVDLGSGREDGWFWYGVGYCSDRFVAVTISLNHTEKRYVSYW